MRRKYNYSVIQKVFNINYSAWNPWKDSIVLLISYFIKLILETPHYMLRICESLPTEHAGKTCRDCYCYWAFLILKLLCWAIQRELDQRLKTDLKLSHCPWFTFCSVTTCSNCSVSLSLINICLSTMCYAFLLWYIDTVNKLEPMKALTSFDPY